MRRVDAARSNCNRVGLESAVASAAGQRQARGRWRRRRRLDNAAVDTRRHDSRDRHALKATAASARDRDRRLAHLLRFLHVTLELSARLVGCDADRSLGIRVMTRQLLLETLAALEDAFCADDRSLVLRQCCHVGGGQAPIGGRRPFALLPSRVAAAGCKRRGDFVVDDRCRRGRDRAGRFGQRKCLLSRIFNCYCINE